MIESLGITRKPANQAVGYASRTFLGLVSLGTLSGTQCVPYKFEITKELSQKGGQTIKLLSHPTIVAVLALLISGAALADTPTRQYHIPAQPLEDALMQFATDTNLRLLFTADKVQGLSAPKLDGGMTHAQALSQLLQGSGITYRFVDANTVTIESPSGNLIKTANETDNPATQTGGEGQVMPKVTVEADAEIDPYDPVNTGAPYNKSYAASNTRTATKMDTPIMETPVSIQVIPRTVMDDQQAISVGDALKNVSGVQPGAATFYDNFILRGFDSNSSTYRNGLRQQAVTTLETANLERIEVLKGPAAVLFGRIEPGGLVNLTTKRPLEEAYYSIQQQFGSYDLYRTTIDATGPVFDDRSLLYRMNIAYKSNNSFRDFVSQEHIFVAPSLTWQPTDKFEANLDIEYQHNEFIDNSDNGIPAIGNRPAPVPISRFLGDPAANNIQDRELVGLNWSYKFNDDWKLTNRFHFLNVDYDQTTLFANGLGDDNRTYTRGLWHVPFNRTSYGTNLDLTGHFKTGLAEHDVLVGFDYYRYNLSASGFLGDAPSIDIFNPVYGVDIPSLTADGNNYFFEESEQWYGVYFQDQITLWDKLHILGGGRHDWAEIGSGFSPSSLNDISVENRPTEFFSPRVGILYQPWQWLSLYGNYVESLGSNNSGTPPPGSGSLAPQTSQQWEVGLKTEFFNGRLNSTLAFFDLTKQNVATQALNSPFSRTIGEANSQGVELDISGQITDNISLIGSYAYTDAKITKDLGGTEGNQLVSVPRNSGSLWAKYEFNDELLRGLSLSTGVFVRGQREGDIDNSVQLPSYARWDASVGYSFKQFGSKITTQFNVYNILDKQYYDHGNFKAALQPGTPLTFLGSVRMEF